jgi:hypothetical protein
MLGCFGLILGQTHHLASWTVAATGDRPRYLSRRRLGEGGSEAALHGFAGPSQLLDSSS